MISGMAGHRGELSGAVWAAPSLNGTDCAGIDWSSAEKVHEFSGIEVADDGTLTDIGEFTWDRPGPMCLTYSESLFVRDLDLTVNHDPGDDDQTQLVVNPSGGGGACDGLRLGVA